MPWILCVRSLCLHRQVLGQKWVLLVSAVNLLKNHSALCFFRRLVFWKDTDKLHWFLLSHPATMAKLGEKNGRGKRTDEWAAIRRSDLKYIFQAQVPKNEYSVIFFGYPTTGENVASPRQVLIMKLHTTASHTGCDLPGLSTKIFLDKIIMKSGIETKYYLLNYLSFQSNHSIGSPAFRII